MKKAPKKQKSESGVVHPSASFTVRMPKQLKAKINKIAAQQRRSLSAQICLILEDATESYFAQV